MILVATTNTVIARLSGVPSVQWPIQVSYGDLTATTLTGGQQLSVTNSTTNVTILAAPAASTQRQIKNINIYNAGASVLTLTIVIDVSGVETIVWRDTVPVGKSLTWTDESGWAISSNTSGGGGGGGGAVTDVFGRTGNVVAVAGDYTASQVTNVAAGNIVATDVQAAVNELDTEKVAKAGDTMTGNLIVNKSGAAVPTAFGADELRIVGSTGADALIWSDSFAGPPVFGGRRAQGVPGTPTAVQSGNTLVAMRGYGYGSTLYSTSHRGSVTVIASENWSDAAQGTRLVLATTPNGAASQSARWFVENDGSLIHASGALTGNGTVNAINYFDDGVNINTIYAGLASANVFTAIQTIDLNAAALPAPPANTALHIGGVDAANSRLTLDAFGGIPNITSRRSNGTAAAPTAVLSSETLFVLGGFGYGATGYSAAARATITYVTTEAWTDTAQGTRINFATTTNGAAGVGSRWSVDNDGTFRADSLGVTGNGTVNAINYFDDGVNINTIYAGLAAANVFTQVQTINLNTSALPAPSAGNALQIGALDGQVARITLDAFGTNTSFTGRRANGTNAAKTGVVNADILVAMTAFGWDTSAYAGGGNVQIVATETWSGTARGTRHVFQNITNGAAIASTKWNMEQDGTLRAEGLGNTGFGTVNANDYFDNGVNINTIYSSIAGHAANSVLGRAGNTVGPIADIAATTSGHVLTYNGTDVVWAAPTAGSGVNVQDEGIAILTPATTLNFVGAGVTATNGGGGVATITIPGGGASTYDYGMYFALRASTFF